MAASLEQAAWVEHVLGVRAAGTEDLEGASHELRGWKVARAAWDQASDAADGQIAALQKALQEDEDPELQEIAELGLNAVTGNFRVPLRAALMAVDRAAETPDENAVAGLRKAVDGFVRHLVSDPRVAACDDNPVGVRVRLVDTLVPALHDLDDAAALLARA